MTTRKKTGNKIETMGKKTKEDEIPSLRDAACSFAEAIIAERRAFKRMYRESNQMYLVFRWLRKEEIRKNQSR